MKKQAHKQFYWKCKVGIYEEKKHQVNMWEEFADFSTQKIISAAAYAKYTSVFFNFRTQRGDTEVDVVLLVLLTTQSPLQGLWILSKAHIISSVSF